jgi:hypothetical protein
VDDSASLVHKKQRGRGELRRHAKRWQAFNLWQRLSVRYGTLQKTKPGGTTPQEVGTTINEDRIGRQKRQFLPPLPAAVAASPAAECQRRSGLPRTLPARVAGRSCGQQGLFLACPLSGEQKKDSNSFIAARSCHVS